MYVAANRGGRYLRTSSGRDRTHYASPAGFLALEVIAVLFSTWVAFYITTVVAGGESQSGVTELSGGWGRQSYRYDVSGLRWEWSWRGSIPALHRAIEMRPAVPLSISSICDLFWAGILGRQLQNGTGALMLIAGAGALTVRRIAGFR